MAQKTRIRKYERPGRTIISFRTLGIPNLVRLGREQNLRARLPLQEHRHRMPMEICYLAGGQQTFEIDDQPYRMDGGDVLVSQPGQKHSSGSSPIGRSTLYWLLVTHDVSGGCFLGHDPDEGGKLVDALAALGTRKFRGSPVLHRCLDDIFAAFFDAGNFRKTLVRMLVTEFLVHVVELSQRSTRIELSPGILSALGYVHEHLGDHIALETLAESASLSLSHFKQCFRREVGLPPREYILRQKVERAGELLRTGMGVTEIAHELGFSSSQYFATVFRRFSGMSPTKFRAQT